MAEDQNESEIENNAAGGLGGAAYRHARRVVISVVGVTVLALGAVMLVTPGPGVVVLLVGLSVLGVEFAWARKLLRRAKVSARLASRRLKR